MPDTNERTRPTLLLHGPNPAAGYRRGGVATWMTHLAGLAEAAGLRSTVLPLDPPALIGRGLPKPAVIAGGVVAGGAGLLAATRAGGAAVLHVNTSLYPRIAFRDGPIVAAARVADVPVLLQIHGGRLSSLAGRPVAAAAWRGIFQSVSIIGVFPGPQWEELEQAGWGPKLRPMRNVVPETGKSVRRASTARFLYLGALTEAKGAPGLIEAFVALRDSGVDASLVIGGAGPLEERLRERVANSAHARGIQLVGHVRGEALERILDGCDVFVLPSRAEGFPLSFLECAERGMACVVTRNSAVTRLFDVGHEVLAVDSTDMHGLTLALRRVAEDEGLRANLGKAVQARVRAEYTIPAAAPWYRGLIDELAGSGGPTYGDE